MRTSKPLSIIMSQVNNIKVFGQEESYNWEIADINENVICYRDGEATLKFSLSNSNDDHAVVYTEFSKFEGVGCIGSVVVNLFLECVLTEMPAQLFKLVDLVEAKHNLNHLMTTCVKCEYLSDAINQVQEDIKEVLVDLDKHGISYGYDVLELAKLFYNEEGQEFNNLFDEFGSDY